MKIAFLGLGAMGERMARHLLDAGHELTVWNRTPARAVPFSVHGATLAETPKEAAEGNDLVISMVRDDEASAEVWDDAERGAIAGLKNGAIAMESSTLTVARMKQLGEKVAEAGGRFLDAPVSGSRPQADAASLIFLVGGKADVIDKVRAVLMTMGGAIQHAGEAPGDGTTMKLIVNGLMGVQVAALGEYLAFGEKNGIAAGKTAEILGQVPVTSQIAKNMMALMVEHQHDPLFPVELIEKDFANILATAEACSASVPVSDRTRAVFAKGIHAGLGRRNLTSIATLYETGKVDSGD